MNLMSLVDGQGAAIVFGGTIVATLMRCGLADCKVTARVVARLGRRRFNADRVRSQLAVQIREIQSIGVVRADPHVFGDSEFDEAADALIETRSVTALLEKHGTHRARRVAAAGTAARTLAQAAELSPVFGLAGTLISLSQMPANGITQASYTGAISMAVLTTLYGIIGANLLFAPLSRAVDRAIAAEESERQHLFDWLAAQVGPACPPRRSVAINREAA